MNIDGHTKMYCLICSPVGHSGSPSMYNYSFDRLGINSAYLAYDVPLEKTGEAVAALRLLGCGGFNVTMPCKTEVTKYLDRLSPACELIGASNCVVVEADGTLTGHNTDGLGFVANLRVHGVDVKGRRMVILGAGGAGTAVTMQSAVDGASEIHIFNRKGYTFYPNAELTVKKITERIPACKASVTDLADKEALAEAVRNCDILVNATKVGMAPLDGETLIDPSLFRADLVVADTVYNPKETRMILEAKAAGVKAAIGGIGMLLRQGVEGFRLYTGREMPADEVMDKFFA